MRIKLVLILLGCLCIMSAQAMAAAVTLTANDAIGTTSFNAAGKWSDLAAPSAGNTYSTLGYLLRSPTVAGSYTFAGDSLTIGGGNGGGANPFLTTGAVNNNALIAKIGALTLTANYILDAGTIRDGLGSADSWAVAGAIAVSANGGGFANQCGLSVDALLSGSGPLYICDNGSGEAARVTKLTNALNSYNGSIKLVGSSDGRSRLTLTSTGAMNFTIGANGVNNNIFGTGTATLDGVFNIDLTSASTTPGDSWALVSSSVKTFNPTFTVNGFTDLGGDVWSKTIGSTTYAFAEASGILLVVPEPASIVMILTGLLGLAMFWLRRK